MQVRRIDIDGGTGNSSEKSMEELLAEGMKKRGYDYSDGTFTKSGGSGTSGQPAQKSMEELLAEGMKKRGYGVENGVFTAPKPFVSQEEYAKTLSDRVKASEGKVRLYTDLTVPAPDNIAFQNRQIMRFTAEADTIFKTNAWRSNPLVYDMYKRAFEQRNAALSEKERMERMNEQIRAEALAAVEENREAVDAWNQFVSGSGEGWDSWRRTVRSEEAIEPELKETEKAVNTLGKQIAREREDIEARAGDFAYTNGGVEPAAFKARRNALAEKEKELEAATKRYDLLREEMDYSRTLKWEELRKNSDFAAASAYRSTANGNGPRFSAITGIYSETGYDDDLYEYINGNKDVIDKLDTNSMSSGSTVLGFDNSFLKEMTEDEVAMYNYVYATQGKEKAGEYLKYLSSSLNERRRLTEENRWREYSEKDAVGASLASVLASPAKGLSYLGQATEYMATGKIDQNAGYNRFSYIPSAIRDQVSQKIEKNWGKVGSFLYQTGMSMADFLFDTAISGGNEALSLAIMGTGAAADAVVDAKDRGLSDRQSFILGTVAGIAEIATEKVSLEALLDKTALSKTAMGYFLKNVAAEGSEEAASDVINWAAEVLVAQDKSQWKQAIKAYTDSGMSEKKAFYRALGDKAVEIGLDALGGALSGGVMAAGGSIASYADAQRAGQSVSWWNESEVRGLIDEARSYGQDKATYQAADRLERKINSGREISRADVGYLQRAVEAERQAANASETPRETTAGQKVQEPSEGAQSQTAGSVRPQAQTEELTLQERRDALEKREKELRQRTEEYLGSLPENGEDTTLYQELYDEGEALSRERSELEELERQERIKAEDEEYRAGVRSATVAPTAEEYEKRRELIKNLDELERSGRESGAGEEQISMARRIANATGRAIVFFNETSPTRGEYRNGTIYVNTAFGNETGQIIAHELTHSIEESEDYGALSRLIQNRIMESGGDLEGMLSEIRERYAKAGVTLDRKSGADMKEVVAEYVARELLTNEESITSLCRDDRSLGRRILDLLDKLLAKLKIKASQEREFVRRARDLYAGALNDTRGSLGEQQAKNELRRAYASGEMTEEEFDRAYDAVDTGGDELTGAGQHSISPNLWEDLDSVLSGTFDSQSGEIEVGNTSDFLTNIIGAEQVTVTMPANKAYNAMVTEEQAKRDRRYDPNQHYHGLGVDGLLRALTESENPVAAFADTPDYKGNNRVGRIVLVTDMKDNAGSNVVVVDELSTQGYINGKRFKVNKTITAYPRETAAGDIIQAAADGRLLTLDKKRSPSIDSGKKGATSPTAISNAELKNNIQRFWASVNWKNEGRKYSSTSGTGDGKTEVQRAFERAEGIIDTKKGTADGAVPSAQNGRGSLINHGSDKKILQKDGDVKRQYSISNEEIQAVQNIGRKSVNEFSAEDIEKTGTFAERYYQEMGTKSPFFRAWFGDWRANDTTPVQVANEQGDARGVQRNEDTGWDVQVSGKVFRETEAHTNPINREAVRLLPYINDIVKKAVLLDSYAMGKTKSVNSLMMHSLYAVADMGNGPELIKLYVEEMNDPNRRGTAKRAYQIQNIEISSLTGASAIGSGKALASFKTADIETIADLFAAVKSKDSHFNPSPASKIVDEDGRPLTVYHGTDASFNVFDRSKGRSTMDIQGSFFSPWELDAEGYGGNVRAYFLNIKNPAPEGVAYRALNRFKGQNNAGVKAREYLESLGYDGVDNSGEEFIAFNPEQIKLAEGNRGTFDRSNPDVRYSIAAEETQENTEERGSVKTDIRETVPAKAREHLRKAERGLVNRTGAILQVPRAAQREFLQDIAAEMSREYLTEGSISQETRDKLFEEAYSRGVEVDREFYEQYKDLKKRLRETPVTVAEKDRANVLGYDSFQDFRRAAFGILRIVNEGGTPADVMYQGLQAEYPELFPENLTDQGAQISRMFEVGDSIRISEKALDEAMGRDAKDFRVWARNEFESVVGDTIAELRQVKRYAEDRAATVKAPELTLEQVKELYPKARDARKNYEKVSARNLLTQEDQRQVGRLMRGDIELSDLKPERDNVKGITAVYEAKQEYEKYAGQIREWNDSRKAQLRQEADEFLVTANGWKDKSKGILYSRETMERNIRDIVPDGKLADRIVDRYFKPVHDAAAKSTKLKNRMRDRVRALNLSRRVAEGNTVSESHAVQLLGEAMDNIDYLQRAKFAKERDGKTLSDWRGVVQELREKNPNMDWNKVENAVLEFRRIYDELFELMNDSRVRNGYEPVAYRKGYFPHFQPGDSEGLLSQFGKALGINVEVSALPTSINGLTHTFRPGIQYFGNALERTGFNTAYDAVEGFDKYIEGVADVIYQTENIQRLRALASQVRYRTTTDGIREQVDAVLREEGLAERDRVNRINEIYEKGRFTLSNFVVELEEYTNLLANKKSRADRNTEQALGRKMYNMVKTLEGRVAANMVAINPGSWLTNFIPLTQGWAMLDRTTLLRGMWDTLKSIKTDDGIVDASSFLTNRRGSDPLVRTWQQSASAKLSKPMEWIDNFTAGSLVRGRYQQNLSRGMSEAAAMEEADAWVAGVMADRSKGSTPTLFNRSNPLTKLLTQFQLEVNNQLSYVFKDVPRAYKEKGLGALAAALFKFALGAWLYDELYEYLIGRRPALDPIGIVNDTVGDLTGYELPNLVSMGVDLASGKAPSFKTKKGNALGGLINNVADQLPFMGAVGAIGLDDAFGLDIDAGRLSVESAIPNLSNVGKALSGENDWPVKKRVQTAVKEISKPLTYLLLPFGGGQMKKILQGVSAAIKGGSYTVDEKGRDIMQYPVYTDTAWEKANAYVGGAVFGKSSGSNAVRWVENNFKNYSAKATGAYQGLTAAGVRGRDADNLIIALAGAEKTEDKTRKQVQIELLRESSIPKDLKYIPYYAMIASELEMKLMDEFAGYGIAGDVLDMLMEYYEADGKAEAQRAAVFGSKLTDNEKIKAMEILSPKTSYTAFKMQTAKDNGIGMKDYYAVVYNAPDSNGDGKITQDDIVKAIRKLSLTNKQKAVLYQLADSGYTPKGNPFSRSVGQEIYDMVQKEKERRENSADEEEGDKETERWKNGKLVIPKG